jgi:hypothetical protein
MLFKATPDIQPYSEVNTAVNFDSLKSSITAAEHEFIVPVIGLTLYNVLNAAYTAVAAETDLSLVNQALLNAVRMALAPYTMMVYANKAELQFGDGGLRRQETANAKTAFQYQTRNLKDQLKKEGDRGTEMLLSFLEINATDYPQWTASEEFAFYRSLFIKTGTEFNKYYITQSPQRNYLALRAVMKDVEDLVIKKSIGIELFTDLKTKTTAVVPAVLSTEESALLEILKKAIANFTIARGIHLLAARIDEFGITVTSPATFASQDELSKRAGAANAQINGLASSAYNTGSEYLAEAIAYLVKYASGSVLIPWYTVNGTLLLAAAELNPLSINETLNGAFSL